MLILRFKSFIINNAYINNACYQLFYLLNNYFDILLIIKQIIFTKFVQIV